MPIGILFWVIWLFCLIFGMWISWPAAGVSFAPVGLTLVEFVLFGLLGWKVFGAPLQKVSLSCIYLLVFGLTLAVAAFLGSHLWSKWPPYPPWMRTREDDP